MFIPGDEQTIASPLSAVSAPPADEIRSKLGFGDLREPVQRFKERIWLRDYFSVVETP